MHFSIVTAGFSVQYIDVAWDSIKKQTHKEWEWILVCDNSESIRNWYKVKKDSGEFEGSDVWFIDIGKTRNRYGLVSRNVGAQCASYNRIIFLDDDNAFEEPDYLETIAKTIEETGLIPYTQLHLLGKKIGSTYDRYKRTGLGRHHIDLGNFLYFKQHLIKYGYFDDSKNRIMFDWDLMEKIINGEGVDKFILIKKHLVFRHKRY